MATIQQLCAQGILHKIDPGLDDDEQEFRLLYASTDVVNFMRDDLPNLPSFHDPAIKPSRDLAALVAEYASGLPIEFDRQVKAFRRNAFDVLA
jgi:hypothetical protein